MVTVAGRPHTYVPSEESPDNRWTFEDSSARVELAYDGAGFWTLRLTARVPIENVAFPWTSSDYELPAPGDDDRVLYPFIGGISERAGIRGANTWWGLTYPGGCFAPLVVEADRTTARIIAATNTPPRRVQVLIGRRRVQMLDATALAAGETRTLGALVYEAHGDAQAGDPPWMLALRPYRRWLTQHALREETPAWMQLSDGFLMESLQNMPAFEPEQIRARWQRWRERFPWVQIWGQMSHYAGPASIAQPPRDPSEPTGCCLPRVEMHRRYVGLLDALVAEVRARGDHVGFYAAPSGGALDEARGVDWLRRWIARNRAFGANAFYVDVLGRMPLGEPSSVLAQFDNGTIPTDALIEGYVDVYPRAALLSGMLGIPGVTSTPRGDPETCERCAFPAFARALMESRPAFAGVSNGDHRYFGPSARPPFEGEREVFLLGAKYDAGLDVLPAVGPAQPSYLRDILDARASVRFNARAPRYRHTLGLSEISLGISVRRFDTSDGAVLLAVDNPQRLEGASVRLRGQRVTLPASAVSMVEVEGAHAAQ